MLKVSSTEAPCRVATAINKRPELHLGGLLQFRLFHTEQPCLAAHIEKNDASCRTTADLAMLDPPRFF